MLFTVWSRTSTLAAGLNVNMREILLFTPKWNLNFETAETLLKKLVSPCTVLILNKSQEKKQKTAVSPSTKLHTSFFCFLMKIWCPTFEVWRKTCRCDSLMCFWVTVASDQQDWSESQTCCWISLMFVLVFWDLLTTRKIQKITRRIRKHLLWFSKWVKIFVINRELWK